MPVKLGSRVPTGVRGPLTPRPEIGRRYSVGRSTPPPSLLSPPSLSPSFVHPRGVVKREKVKKKKTRGLGSGVNGIGNNRGIPCDKHAGNDQAERRFEKIQGWKMFEREKLDCNISFCHFSRFLPPSFLFRLVFGKRSRNANIFKF